MRAVILRQPKVLEMTEVPKPRLTEKHHVLIKVVACGICGSDLRYWMGENPWALHTLGHHIPNPPNIILGHEFAGIVAEVNSSTYEHLLGRRVGAQAFRVCGECKFCRSGRENLCPRTIHIGHAQGWGEMEVYPGAYADYCLAWGDLLYAIPDDVPLENAAMADVVCVAVHVVGRSRNVCGDVLCIGGGPIGLSIAQVARARGARNVFVSEPSPQAREVLTRFSDIVAIDPTREAIADVLLGSIGCTCVTTIYDSIGTTETMIEALPLLEESGTYVNVAIHDSPLTFSAASLGSERTITSSSNAFYSDVEKAYELICTGRVDVQPMLTHRFALQDYAEAFELLLRTPKEAFKAILMPGDDRMDSTADVGHSYDASNGARCAEQILGRRGSIGTG